MKNRILKIVCSLFLASSFSFTLASCGNNTPKTEQNNNTNTRPSRKPQVNINGNNANKDQTIYSDGEIISLVDGSKLKYNEEGNHELLQKGDGTVIIFKNASQDEINKLTPEQKIMIERQMEADPNGFLVIY